MMYQTTNDEGNAAFTETHVFEYGRTATEGFIFFAHATAAGGASIPTELVGRLTKLGRDFRLTPEKILRLIRQCEEKVWAMADHGHNPPLGYDFSYSRGGYVEVTYWATPPYGNDPTTRIKLVIVMVGDRKPTATVEVIGCEESVYRRGRCGITGKTYAEVPGFVAPVVKIRKMGDSDYRISFINREGHDQAGTSACSSEGAKESAIRMATEHGLSESSIIAE